MKILTKNIEYFGMELVLYCDGKCNKAWGHNSRPQETVTDKPDDTVYLADGELGEAPEDPGTYEGGYGKPGAEDEKLNKWCCRECERSGMKKSGEPMILDDFSKRQYNYRERNVDNTITVSDDGE